MLLKSESRSNKIWYRHDKVRLLLGPGASTERTIIVRWGRRPFGPSGERDRDKRADQEMVN
jgi:hypothetical protein